MSRLRSLRVQVSIALVLAASLCAYASSKSSSDELNGAYRDSARTLLQAASATFEQQLDTRDLDRPSALVGDLRELIGVHPELTSIGIYRAGDSHAAVSVGEWTSGRTELRLVMDALDSGRQISAAATDNGRPQELLVTPLGGGPDGQAALAASYDLGPATAALAERNDRVVIFLAALLASFAVFTLVVLQRGIFRPLGKLQLAARAVGAGDMGTRLGWRRRDELGDLARDFDTMAAALEERGRRLEELVHSDPLTGLANHRRFQEVLSGRLEDARRDGRPLAVALVDIDDFKRVNETRGHPFGDQVLGAAGCALSAALDGHGVVARVGGDEFGVILPDLDGAHAAALADEARIAIEGAGAVRGSLRCSAGVACYPADARTAGALLQLADGALSWAKATGGGHSRRYDAEHVFVITDEQREDFAARISRRDVLYPVFQPIVSLTSGCAVGYEALARFTGKPGPAPSWWFAQAHRFGLGAALEADAARLALAQAGRPSDTFLSINLSPSALVSVEVQEGLPDDLEGVVIEITEAEHVLDADALQDHLDPLRLRGARIAVDDAGEGYAGLQQVMRMRADIIKLDRALVADVNSDPAKIALIGSLVHFARSTGASICAEGIETLDELRVLVHLGVAMGQGWALGRPGDAWPDVTPEAADLCLDLHGERGQIVPLGARRSA